MAPYLKISCISILLIGLFAILKLMNYFLPLKILRNVFNVAEKNRNVIFFDCVWIKRFIQLAHKK